MAACGYYIPALFKNQQKFIIKKLLINFWERYCFFT